MRTVYKFKNLPVTKNLREIKTKGTIGKNIDTFQDSKYLEIVFK